MAPTLDPSGRPEQGRKSSQQGLGSKPPGFKMVIRFERHALGPRAVSLGGHAIPGSGPAASPAKTWAIEITQRLGSSGCSSGLDDPLRHFPTRLGVAALWCREIGGPGFGGGKQPWGQLPMRSVCPVAGS